jgi:hypothetical protein
MNLIKKIKNIFSKKKSIDYKKDYWFPTIDSPDPIYRMIKLNKIYKKNKSIYHAHYNFVNHSIKKTFIIPVGSNNIAFGYTSIVSGYNNIAYGYSSFPNPINKIRIKKLTKIYGRAHEV